MDGGTSVRFHFFSPNGKRVTGTFDYVFTVQ